MHERLRVVLRDIDARMVSAWRRAFAAYPEVEISDGDIFAHPADAIVSPANSFGFMDGGIDLVYLRRFGRSLQERLQERLAREHDGELPVGQAIVVETGDAQFPYLVSAPTMRIPMDVADTANAYLALRAAIRAVRVHNGTPPIRTVVVPGLCTATGHMPHDRVARQMLAAYVTCALGEIARHPRLGSALDAHHALVA